VAGVVGGVAGAGGAVWAAVAAVGARREAARSAAAAEDSADSARGSLDVMRAEAARAVERVDVGWARQRNKRKPGFVTLRNIGSTTAYDVAVVLTINGDRIELAPGNVAPGGLVEHDATDIYRAESQAASAAMARASAAGVFYAASTKFRVSARITWQSELGTPDVLVIAPGDLN
jgi:hypothetical protein